MSARVGVVAIGRNEGERLRRCLDSLAGTNLPVVYVDSDSTDGSVELARASGADVVELDLTTVFTAARARNEGFERLLALAPDLELVQFVDGDCELDPEWIPRALRELDARPEVAVVCGRRRERAPDATVYNRVCDMEWDTAVGETDACGGDALMRVADFRAVGGFDPRLIAGEEPELCLRLRLAGRKILRVDAEMTRHDVAMTRFGQWWNRARRTGHTAAEVLALHGREREADKLRRIASAVLWAALVPALGLALLAAGLARGEVTLAAAGVLTPLALWTALFARIYGNRRARGDPPVHCRLYARFCILGKAPELLGALQWLWTRATGGASRWIEYKDAPAKAESEARR
jgi:GT2 family glycosyltransferase